MPTHSPFLQGRGTFGMAASNGLNPRPTRGTESTRLPGLSTLMPDGPPTSAGAHSMLNLTTWPWAPKVSMTSLHLRASCPRSAGRCCRPLTSKYLGVVTPRVSDAQCYVAATWLTWKYNKLIIITMRHDVNSCSEGLFTTILQLTQCVPARHGNSQTASKLQFNWNEMSLNFVLVRYNYSLGAVGDWIRSKSDNAVSRVISAKVFWHTRQRGIQ